MANSSRISKRVAEIYNRLDSQIRENVELAGKCEACGKCCNFDTFDHRLFVSTPELIYLTRQVPGKKLKRMPTAKCPYQVNDKCTIHEYRFAGCRIFCCHGDEDFQSKLSESVLTKFKAVCEKLPIPYRYTDLATALNSFSANTCQSAGESPAAGRGG